MKTNLMLVEDHADTRAVLARILRKKGYEVFAVGTGEDALKLALKIKFDLVIMDHGLPDGDGCKFMRTLHRVNGLEGIALTAYAYESDERLSRKAGFLAHLSKPVNVEELYEAIERNLPLQMKA